MKRSDLIQKVASELNISNKAAKKIIDAFFDSITEALKEGESVSISGFGTFSVSNRRERIGRNPMTGKSIKIAAHRVVRFKTARKLNRLVAGDTDHTGPRSPRKK